MYYRTMTHLQELTDNLSNSIQAGVNSSLAPKLGVGQLRAIETAIAQLGLKGVIINSWTLNDQAVPLVLDGVVKYAISAELFEADVVVLDEVLNTIAGFDLLEGLKTGFVNGQTLRKLPVLVVRDSYTLQGFTPLD